MNLLTSETIEEYFNEYVIDEEYPIKTVPGFRKYLIAVKKFCKSSLKDYNERMKSDVDLVNYIKGYCEGALVDSALIGTAHASMAQFVLKNKHGYVDRKDESDEAVKAPEIKISIDPRSSKNEDVS